MSNLYLITFSDRTNTIHNEQMVSKLSANDIRTMFTEMGFYVERVEKV